MKYFLLLLLIVTCGIKPFAQNSSGKVEQYCIVNCYFGRKSLTANFDFGNETKLWDWEITKDSTGKVLQFKSEADVLNYLGKKGWKLVTAYIKNESSFAKFVFKKKFLKTEIKEE